MVLAFAASPHIDGIFLNPSLSLEKSWPREIGATCSWYYYQIHIVLLVGIASQSLEVVESLMSCLLQRLIQSKYHLLSRVKLTQNIAIRRGTCLLWEDHMNIWICTKGVESQLKIQYSMKWSHQRSPLLEVGSA